MKRTYPDLLGRPPVVLVCLSGKSPAVVTETLYALCVTGRSRVIPRRVCILTTEDAYAEVVSSLVGSRGTIHRLVSDYRLPNTIQCAYEDVFVIKSRSGKPLSDIRSSADSSDAGEYIAKVLAELHSDPAVEIHCSIAGGRKTMSALMALALQICARPGDRLYHVLVNEPFESIPDFYYPPRQRKLYSVDGKIADSRKARIDLAEVPMIRLGAVAESLGLGAEQLALRARKIEQAANRGFRPSPVDLDFKECELRFKTGAVRLPPQEFALYAVYAGLRRRCKACRRNRSQACKSCHPTDGEIFARYRPLLRAVYYLVRPSGGPRLMKMLEDADQKAENAQDFDEWLRQTRSRIGRGLRASGAGVPALAFISDSKDIAAEKGTRRGLRLPPDLIHFTNVGTGNPNVDLLATRGGRQI
jgi:CRISPR-associated protein (TIGR02584 family)